MIRVKVTAAKLRAAIRAVKPTFFTDADAILAALPNSPRSSDFKPLWSDIKQVYIDLQFSKCCFCEKPLEAKIEQDVEHFRPKAAVTAWKVPTRLTNAGVTVTQPVEVKTEPGYTLLAYHPLNYAMSCKQCNSVLKKNYFPIAGKRRSGGRDPTKMGGERAYLIYPVGDNDNPEDLITFEGLSPIPKAAVGFDRLRALVTIELFKLDHVPTRRVLFKGRAYLLRLLYLELEALKGTTDRAKSTGHKKAIAGLTGDECPFANCMRSFERLYRTDPALAGQYADECLKYINTKSLRWLRR
jgi:hypothetical protein